MLGKPLENDDENEKGSDRVTIDDDIASVFKSPVEDTVADDIDSVESVGSFEYPDFSDDGVEHHHTRQTLCEVPSPMINPQSSIRYDPSNIFPYHFCLPAESSLDPTEDVETNITPREISITTSSIGSRHDSRMRMDEPITMRQFLRQTYPPSESMSVTRPERYFNATNLDFVGNTERAISDFLSRAFPLVSEQDKLNLAQSMNENREKDDEEKRTIAERILRSFPQDILPNSLKPINEHLEQRCGEQQAVSAATVGSVSVPKKEKRSRNERTLKHPIIRSKYRCSICKEEKVTVLSTGITIPHICRRKHTRDVKIGIGRYNDIDETLKNNPEKFPVLIARRRMHNTGTGQNNTQLHEQFSAVKKRVSSPNSRTKEKAKTPIEDSKHDEDKNDDGTTDDDYPLDDIKR